jgi:hypothetical protein
MKQASGRINMTWGQIGVFALAAVAIIIYLASRKGGG